MRSLCSMLIAHLFTIFVLICTKRNVSLCSSYLLFHSNGDASKNRRAKETTSNVKFMRKSTSGHLFFLSILLENSIFLIPGCMPFAVALLFTILDSSSLCDIAVFRHLWFDSLFGQTHFNFY